MKQQREKFRVIGSCRRMQTLSLEEEFKRIEGVPYIIDFYQDFSTGSLENFDNTECIPEIIYEIMNPKVIDVRQKNDNFCLKDKQESEEFWRRVDKMEKEEAKRVKKWEKHHEKMSDKQLLKYFKCFDEENYGG